MKLQEFVSETLVAIAAGVQVAQKGVAPLGGSVNPYVGSATAIQNVEFDVEVSTSEGSATKGGLGVFVGPIGAGTQGQSQAGSASVGRIRFQVPLQMPYAPRGA